MDLIYTRHHDVKSFQIDFKSQMRPSSMVRLFQEAAMHHAEELGVGYEALKAEGIFWVLSRIEMQIMEPLLWEDKYDVRTWPVEFEGLLFRRDFEFIKEGKIICKGSSGWLLVSEEKRRPVRPSSLKIKIPSLIKDNKASFFEQKIKFEHAISKELIKVGYSDVDMNQHANNTRYFDWLLQCIDKEVLENGQIKSITIEYVKEANWGDTLELCVEQKKENNQDIYMVEALNQTNKKCCFRGLCTIN